MKNNIHIIATHKWISGSVDEPDSETVALMALGTNSLSIWPLLHVIHLISCHFSTIDSLI